mmetsp:Transcript_23299/g.67999  ORF Transcript_23299/g.67999 Transcript_23299/m.67999 type:complete len:229 (+) Transcript_23299:479-1165(+)
MQDAERVRRRANGFDLRRCAWSPLPGASPGVPAPSEAPRRTVGAGGGGVDRFGVPPGCWVKGATGVLADRGDVKFERDELFRRRANGLLPPSPAEARALLGDGPAAAGARVVGAAADHWGKMETAAGAPPAVPVTAGLALEAFDHVEEAEVDCRVRMVGSGGVEEPLSLGSVGSTEGAEKRALWDRRGALRMRSNSSSSSSSVSTDSSPGDSTSMSENSHGWASSSSA